MNAVQDAVSVLRQFQIAGQLTDVTPYGGGHINDSYRAVYQDAGGTQRYLLQRINHAVFKNPPALMENIARVTAHLTGKSSAPQRTLCLIRATLGDAYHQDDVGNWWRVYRFIENAHSCEAAQTPAQALEAAKCVGHFQRQLADLPAPRLHDTIPDFHHTPKRHAAFRAAVEADVLNRAASVKAEIDFALRHEATTRLLLEADLPERVTHNDTKINNVLLDDTTGEGVCLVDLDTVMPGLVVYDFGDMVRTTTSPAEEDERDLTKVTMRLPMFAALLQGYLEATEEFLTDAERNLLVCSGKVITLEMGLRFLTDYLVGDTYYKTQRPGQNLDRCRAQFHLVQSLEDQEEAMHHVMESWKNRATA